MVRDAAQRGSWELQAQPGVLPQGLRVQSSPPVPEQRVSLWELLVQGLRLARAQDEKGQQAQASPPLVPEQHVVRRRDGLLVLEPRVSPPPADAQARREAQPGLEQEVVASAQRPSLPLLSRRVRLPRRTQRQRHLSDGA